MRRISNSQFTVGIHQSGNFLVHFSMLYLNTIALFNKFVYLFPLFPQVEDNPRHYPQERTNGSSFN